MNQYGAHILATARRTELAAEAAAARQAAALREPPSDQPSSTTDRRIPAPVPATA
ncbi:MAG TPA: hypothetical protein VH969_12445 [Actinophytocola sp.]|uniref:hypothetical protein n=1 Tax=Actinophytocola sp. TaxID=1872138 RepID=UPI002F9236FF